jgi:DNA-binding PadR family transcriptional regulator
MKAAISPEPALLGFLQDGPLHGYDLHKQVSAQLGPVWHVGLSQLYAILKEYQERGWLAPSVTPQSGRPARTLLKLTPAGKRAFDTWMHQTARGVREFRVDFFARLYFAQQAGRPALRAFLAHQLRATRAELAALQDEPATSPFAADVTHFRQLQLRAVLEWLEQAQRAAQTQGRRGGARK